MAEKRNFFYKTEKEINYLYLDVDMFYVAVELLERPELVEKPVIVGSSIVCTANYVARKFGIRSAMPVFVAKKLCPQLIELKLNSQKYRDFSKKIKKILKIYD